MPKNTESARRALDVYASREGSCSNGDPSRTEDYQCDLVDLIADLLHLADELGTNHGLLGQGGTATLASASMHYAEELEDE